MNVQFMAGTDVLANAWVRLVVLNLIVRLSEALAGASSITYAEIAHRGRTFFYFVSKHAFQSANNFTKFFFLAV